MDDFSRIYLPPTAGNPVTVEHPNQIYNVADDNATYSTGDLRRMYDYQPMGSVFTLLTMQRDPFLHLMNTLKSHRLKTGDAIWKYPIKRDVGSVKRYGYIVGLDADATVSADYDETNATDTWATFLGKNSNKFKVATGNAFDTINQDDEFSLLVAGDFMTSGNRSNIVGRTSSDTDFIELGVSGTKPQWFLPNKLIKIPLTTTIGGTTTADYAIARILSVYDWTYKNSSTAAVFREGVVLNVKLVKTGYVAATNKYPSGAVAAGSILDVSHSTGTSSIAQKLEPLRTYVSGNAWHEVSGYGSSWRQQPYSTTFGMNQIFKENASLSGRASATVLRFGEVPIKTEWIQAIGDFNWDLGTTAYFGEQFEDSEGVTYTEGLVTYGIANGNVLSLDTTTKTIDDFVDDVSAINDPRYAFLGPTRMIHFCDTATWNWLHKYGGFMKNNIEISTNYRFQFMGMGKINSVPFTRFSVQGQNFDIVRDVHLDGTHIKMVGVDINSCYIRPFIGHENRDVAIYKNVRSLATTGEDVRVDLIQGDMGFMFTDPHKVTIWQ
jgi:hypothetical protein